MYQVYTIVTYTYYHCLLLPLLLLPFRAFQVPDSVVTKLCEEGTVLQCAGGLMVEHKLVQPYITNMDGTIDSVMGLSKALVLELLAQLSKS